MIDFKSVKGLVTAREAAEHYGLTVNSHDGLVPFPRRSQPQFEAGRAIFLPQ